LQSRNLKMFKNFFAKLGSSKIKINTLKFDEFGVNFVENALEISPPEFLEINPSYVLIRNMKFHPQVQINFLEKIENLLKWNFLNLHLSTSFRQYPLGFSSMLNSVEKSKIKLNISKKVKEFAEKQINIIKKIKVFEEILEISPYTKKLNKQKLFRLPIARSPLYKSYFSDAQMKKVREELAAQNKTRWSNIEIIEIYDKFNSNIFSDIRQTSTSKNLMCYPSFSNADLKIKEELLYLIIAKRRDTGELIKGLIRPSGLEKK